MEDLDWAFDRVSIELVHRLEDAEAVAHLKRVAGAPRDATLSASTAHSAKKLEQALESALRDWSLVGVELKA